LVSPGEFVINAEQTAKHFDLIRAINEGKALDIANIPQKFATGGIVKNMEPDVFKPVGKFADGGLVSAGPLRDILKPVMGFSSGGFVQAMIMRQEPQKFATGGLVRNIGQLETITLAKFAQGGYVTDYTSGSEAVNANAMHVSTNVQMKVEVIHDGSTNVEVQQIDENRIRVIAKREARDVVHQESSGVIANDLANPNSRTSKAVQRYVGPRKR
jgi:hypothetical protein